MMELVMKGIIKWIEDKNELDHQIMKPRKPETADDNTWDIVLAKGYTWAIVWAIGYTEALLLEHFYDESVGVMLREILHVFFYPVVTMLVLSCQFSVIMTKITRN